jgi:hypothetical protein
MKYTKPELNLIGAAEGLVLGVIGGNRERVSVSKAPSSFEFEE